MTEHRLANILRAIADGKVVQYKTPTGGAWTDFQPDIHGFPIFNCYLAWRVKPEEMVDYTIVMPSGTVGATYAKDMSDLFRKPFYSSYKDTHQGFCKRTTIDGKVVSLEFIPK